MVVNLSFLAWSHADHVTSLYPQKLAQKDATGLYISYVIVRLQLISDFIMWETTLWNKETTMPYPQE
jgi:hypothetical protein